MSVTLDQAPLLRRRSAVRPARAAVPGDAGRILIISDAWQPQVNGVVRTYENICHALEAQGCTVRVIGPADFRAVALPSYPEIPLALFPGRRLAALIESFAPDAVHIAVEGPLGWAARGWCLARGVPFSTAFHTNFPAYAAVRAPRGLRGGVEALTIAGLRHFHAPARFIYVATASLEEQLRGWGFANRFVRLSRGIDFTLFHPAMPDRRSPGARGTANGAGPVLLYVGRVAPEKNIETFLALRTPGQKVVVGDGPLLPTLRARHPEVIFHGTLRGRALADAYRAADLFVFPSRTDTFGNVVIEALASGLPVAAYDVPGPRDIVAGDARLGAVDADLEAAVARALIAPGTAQERHDLARARFCWNKVAQVFRDHCAELRGPAAVPAG